jgi:hypothetical protein
VRILSTLLLLFLCLSSVADDGVYTRVGKIVAVGDLHGDYDQYIRLLQQNKLIDRKLKWRGDDTHFVQLGDVTDRGPDSLKIIRHLQKLAKQANKAGGKVHVLVGNHEAMNIQTDLRYVHPGEYAALVTKKSPKLQGRYLDLIFRSLLAANPELASTRQETLRQLGKRFPLGYVEHRSLWEPGQELAKWYARRNTVVQLNDTIFLHGGLNPHQETFPSLEEINSTISKEFAPGGVPNLSSSESGPLWYRGLAKNPEVTELPAVVRMLEHYSATRIVVAHSPTNGAVMPRFDGRIVLADVGISKHYGSGLANVVIEADDVDVVHRGERFDLPNDLGLKDYLEKVSKLEPENSRLVRYVESLNRPLLEANQGSSD